MTTAQGRRLLDDIAAFGRPSPLVVLSGGHPFEREDLDREVAAPARAATCCCFMPTQPEENYPAVVVRRMLTS